MMMRSRADSASSAENGGTAVADRGDDRGVGRAGCQAEQHGRGKQNAKHDDRQPRASRAVAVPAAAVRMHADQAGGGIEGHLLVA